MKTQRGNIMSRLNTKFASKRKQYNQAQEAMRHSEAIIKDIRRELGIYIKEKEAELGKLFPLHTRKVDGAFAVVTNSGGRQAAADKPFAIVVQGYKNWHTATPKEIRAVIRIMKEDGWRHIGTDDTGHTWDIHFE
jgi:hypothetical protein